MSNVYIDGCLNLIFLSFEINSPRFNENPFVLVTAYGSDDKVGEPFSCELLKDDNENYKIACGICASTDKKDKFSVLLLDVNLDTQDISENNPASGSNPSEFESKSLVKPIKYISSASSGLTSSIFCFYTEDDKLLFEL